MEEGGLNNQKPRLCRLCACSDETSSVEQMFSDVFRHLPAFHAFEFMEGRCHEQTEDFLKTMRNQQ